MCCALCCAADAAGRALVGCRAAGVATGMLRGTFCCPTPLPTPTHLLLLLSTRLQVVALLRQNPAVAVPTVLNRLTQKDSEWRQVRRQPGTCACAAAHAWHASRASLHAVLELGTHGCGCSSSGGTQVTSPTGQPALPPRPPPPADQGGNCADAAPRFQFKQDCTAPLLSCLCLAPHPPPHHQNGRPRRR